MPTEVALLESRALRVEQMGRVDVLDKVKSLVMLPDGIHVRTEDVARYFEVSTDVVKKADRPPSGRARGERHAGAARR